jgi:HD-like signal output (HDOD) protein
MSLFKRTPPATKGQAATRGHKNPLAALFEDFDEESLVHIYQNCQTTTLQENQSLFENATSIDSLFLILSGCLLLSCRHQSANYIFEFHEGSLCGFFPCGDESEIAYGLKSKTTSNVIEITHHVFNNFPDILKGKLYSKANNTLAKITIFSLSKALQLSSKNNSLTSFIYNNEQKKKEVVQSELIQSVIQKIPKLPTYTGNLLAKLLDENTSIQEIAEPIQKDPSLTGIVLKNVNSAYYGLQNKISNIQQAIVYLGFSNVYQIILNDAVKNIIPANQEFFDIQDHSTVISILSHDISRLSKKSKPINLTTIGILHDIGKIVVLLLKRKYQNIKDLFDLLDDAAIGASLLASWELPACVFQVIENQHVPEFCPPEKLDHPYRDEIAILYLAHVYYDLLVGKNAISTLYAPEYMSMLHLPHTDLLRFYQETIIPNLLKNQKRLPESVHSLLTRPALPENRPQESSVAPPVRTPAENLL